MSVIEGGTSFSTRGVRNFPGSLLRQDGTAQNCNAARANDLNFANILAQPRRARFV
jgi:hypothetical protein